MKRGYLDFTVFYTNDNYKLKCSLLRCKHFDQGKTVTSV